MVTLSFRIGKVHHIILRCEGEARASKERTRGRSRIRARASKDEVVVYAEISQAPIFSLALR